MTLQPLFRLSIILSIGLLTVPAFSADPASHVVLSTGERFAAQFVAIEPDWSITWSIGPHTRKIPMAEIVLWGSYSDNAARTQILLFDGSTLVGDIVRVAEESLLIETQLWGQVHVERNASREAVRPLAGKWRPVPLIPPASGP